MSQGIYANKHDTYICQFFANSNNSNNNVNETGMNQVSSEVLEVIHLFLEEFIDHLMMKSATCFDISHLKSTILEIFSHNLGKQLLVEAEIELVQQQEKEQQDTTYSEAFYTQQLAIQRTFEKYSALENSEIGPVVVIYVTSIVEHLAEYILNLVVAGGDAEDIGIKEVFDVLLEDKQLTHLFQSMNLKEQLEARIRNALLTPLPSPVSLKKNQFIMRSSSVFSIATRNDPDIGNTDDHRPRASSIKSSESVQDRPLSKSSSISKGRRFQFFKEKRNSISLSFTKKSNSSPTTPINTDFDNLIRSGNTKKVTLTPNRLRFIEIKEGSQSATAPPFIPWEKFSSTPTIKGQKNTTKKTLRVPPPPPLPVPPLPRMNGPSPPLTPASSVSSYSYQKSKQQDELHAGTDMVSLDTQKSSPPPPPSITYSGDSTPTDSSDDADDTLKSLHIHSNPSNTNTAGSVLLPVVVIKKSVSTSTEETEEEEEDSLFSSSSMIYALPEISQTFITNVSKEDKGCQTDPIALDYEDDVISIFKMDIDYYD
ncbi:hypothetical protein K501DRAFT_311008 [Backusella circina FSU 941]|nr:hypothetical protein K501DRAFT_311008 [Backusella circina FSU 941]